MPHEDHKPGWTIQAGINKGSSHGVSPDWIVFVALPLLAIVITVGHFVVYAISAAELSSIRPPPMRFLTGRIRA